MSERAPKGWFYFGCDRECGHYLFDERMRSGGYDNPLGKFDGTLCYPEVDGLYVAAVTRLGGHGYTAMAFWDRTVDKRPASNSIFFGPGLIYRPDLLLAQAKQRFPRIFARLPAISVDRAMAEHDAFLASYNPQPGLLLAATGLSL